MAGVVTLEHDLRNRRAVSMWCEAGIQFRSNLLLGVGARIDLHSHSYDHVAILFNGVFDVIERAPDAVAKHYQVVAPRRVSIPAEHEHSFTLAETVEGMPGEVLCMWGGA